MPLGVTITAQTTPGDSHQCRVPVTHVPQLCELAWARCELLTGHDGLHQITLRWGEP